MTQSENGARARVALVTGGNRGIGREIVRQLGKAGLRPLLACREPEKGLVVASALRADGVDAPVVQLDVTCEMSVAAAVRDAEQRFGGIDVLINNAAVLIDEPGGFSASAFDLKDEILRSTFETNVEGPLRTMQALLPGMCARGYGRVVNISSQAGQLAGMGRGYPAYRMSKAALNALTRIMADEVGTGNVKINAMCPGWVRTDMGGPRAERSVEEGADTAIWLATLSADGPTGGFFFDRKPLAW